MMLCVFVLSVEEDQFVFYRLEHIFHDILSLLD